MTTHFHRQFRLFTGNFIKVALSALLLSVTFSVVAPTLREHKHRRFAVRDWKPTPPAPDVHLVPLLLLITNTVMTTVSARIVRMVPGRRRISQVVGDVRIIRCRRMVLDVLPAVTLVMDRMRSVQNASHVLFPMKSRRMAASATVVRGSIMPETALVKDVLRA